MTTELPELLVSLPNTYNVPPVDGGTAPLSDPVGTGHATLHNNLGTAVNNLREAVAELQDVIPVAADHIMQARLMTSTIQVFGDLSVTGIPLVPIIWNLTDRMVTFDAARITVYTPPQGKVIWVDLLLGAKLTTTDGTNMIDLNPANLTSILPKPLEIKRGEYFSTQFGADKFVSSGMEPLQYVVALITSVGDDEPGSDLTVQLNRLM